MAGIREPNNAPKTKREIAQEPAKPRALPVVPENIPQALQGTPQWVAWRFQRRQNKAGKWFWTKPPINPRTGKHASNMDPSTWSTFQEAFSFYHRSGSGVDGVGFVFSASDPFCGVDLDDCRDQATGLVKEWATQIIVAMATFTEVSPTGTGVKIFAQGTLPKGRNRRGHVELYNTGRYFTVTGQRVPGTPLAVEDRQIELERLQRSLSTGEVLPSDRSLAQEVASLTDQDLELIEKAKRSANGTKFTHLWNGDTAGHGSPSEADLALCSHLAFWAGPDVARIDALFRQSGLFRPKWEREDYRTRTINKALTGRTTFYQQSKSRPPPKVMSNGQGDPPRKEEMRKAGDAWKGPAATPNEAVDDPHRLARLFLARHCQHPDGLTLRFWWDEWHRWDGCAYRRVPETELRACLTQRVKAEMDRVNLEDLASWDGQGKPCQARRVTARLIADVAHALAGLTVLPSRIDPPAWINGEGPFPIDETLAARNGLVHLPSLGKGIPTLHPPTPKYFSGTALDYDFDPAAPPPTQWLDFLARLWPDDPQSVAGLQEWMGYVLTTETRQQKMLLLVGPKRSGKGTIARIIRALVGPGNVAAPTLSSLGTNFGLWPLLAKTLAIISDARLSGRTDVAAVTERLLSISGEDALTIDRKNLAPMTTRLAARFMILTNELPRLGDASGALTGRMILLRLTQSWYGKEDTRLTDRLLAELPGILVWAIDGWKRLRQRGYFAQPDAGKDLLGELDDLCSPIGAFVRECCLIGPAYRATVDQLFARWKDWCEAKGRKEHGTEASFGRDLLAAVPNLQKVRLREGVERYRGYGNIGLCQ